MTIDFGWTAKHRRIDGEGNYKGIPFYATRSLHEEVIKFVEQYSVRFGTTPLVLDLGAGRGAFSKRLLDHGFVVEATELPDAAWDVPEVPVSFVDFCAASLPEDKQNRYDFVVAIEVIEHVPDPVMFMKNIHTALKNGGVAIVTTPNILNVGGLALTGWKGEYALFSYDLYWNNGHRNMLPDFLLKAFAKHASFDITEVKYVCTAHWPLKLWISLVPILPMVVWNAIRFRSRWNKLHSVLVAIKAK